MFRSCNVPTESMGIVAIRHAPHLDKAFYDEKFLYQEKYPKSRHVWPVEIDRHTRVLCIRRKNTYEFMDFVKGKWVQIYRHPRESRVRDETIIRLLCRMTHAELDMILYQSFRTIWVNFWFNYTFGKSFDTAKNVFYRERKRIVRLYRTHRAFIRASCPHFPPWEFPKGRKNSSKESPRETACREFMEETGYLRNHFYVHDCDPFVEEYKSTNNRWYNNQYFVAGVVPNAPLPIVNARKRIISQVGEIGDIGWFTFAQVCQLIHNRPYKLDMLYRAMVTVQNRKRREYRAMTMRIKK